MSSRWVSRCGMTLPMRTLLAPGKTNPASAVDQHQSEAEAQSAAVLPDEFAGFAPDDFAADLGLGWCSHALEDKAAAQPLLATAP